MVFGHMKVEYIALFDYEGNPKPIRIRYEDDSEGQKVIEIKKIIEADIKKQFANMNGSKGHQYKYKCETIQDNIVIPFELRFEVNTCFWYLV